MYFLPFHRMYQPVVCLCRGRKFADGAQRRSSVIGKVRICNESPEKDAYNIFVSPAKHNGT